MSDGDAELMALIRAIVADDAVGVSEMLAASPALAAASFKEGATRQSPQTNCPKEIGHYLYAGDTALHMAGAAHRPEIARRLIAAGADIRARNRRGAEPLHYAADGVPGSPRWNPAAQAATVTCLIEAGADPNALDRSGVAPLHRAVRTRCAAAVGALLRGGADAGRANKSGSTPLGLATRATGRGGSGSPAAKAEQQAIIDLLQGQGAAC